MYLFWSLSLSRGALHEKHQARSGTVGYGRGWQSLQLAYLGYSGRFRRKYGSTRLFVLFGVIFVGVAVVQGIFHLKNATELTVCPSMILPTTNRIH